MPHFRKGESESRLLSGLALVVRVLVRELLHALSSFVRFLCERALFQVSALNPLSGVMLVCQEENS